LKGVTLERLAERKELLRSFDTFRRDVDTSGVAEGMDRFTERAFDILTSSRLVEALDLTREPAKLRDHYGGGSPEPVWYGDAGALFNDPFLVARRLVEAGVRFVTLALGHWDWHGKMNDLSVGEIARRHLAMLDRGVSALVEDLHQRGLDKDVTVVVWGEFGRSPRINKEGGR